MEAEINQPRVLVIDDNCQLADNLREILEDDGFAVEVSNNGEDGLKLLSKMNINLVVTDLRMPGIDGMQVVAKVRENWPKIPVAVMTAYGRDRALEDVRSQGAVDILTKPMDLPKFVGLVHRLTHAKFHVLIVEDDADYRANLVQLLEEADGVLPHAVATLVDAQRLAGHIQFSAAIIDVRLPDGSGLQLGERLQNDQRGTPLPIVFVSAFCDEIKADQIHSGCARRTQFLEKPFPSRVLVERIKELLSCD